MDALFLLRKNGESRQSHARNVPRQLPTEGRREHAPFLFFFSPFSAGVAPCFRTAQPSPDSRCPKRPFAPMPGAVEAPNARATRARGAASKHYYGEMGREREKKKGKMEEKTVLRLRRAFRNARSSSPSFFFSFLFSRCSPFSPTPSSEAASKRRDIYRSRGATTASGDSFPSLWDPRYGGKKGGKGEQAGVAASRTPKLIVPRSAALPERENGVGGRLRARPGGRGGVRVSGMAAEH